jgi:hypothetical protein
MCISWMLIHISLYRYVHGMDNVKFVHSRQSLAIACLFFIPIIFKSFSVLFLQLLSGLTLFLVPAIVAVAICLAFFGFAPSSPYTW